jgi:hypothetical protein
MQQPPRAAVGRVAGAELWWELSRPGSGARGLSLCGAGGVCVRSARGPCSMHPVADNHPQGARTSPTRV